MPRHGKRYRGARDLVEFQMRYPLDEALDLIKQTCTAKFDESVDIAVRLGVDPRQADQMVRGAVSLPHGVGKTVKVLVFAEGDAAKAALEAGADFVGGEDLINKIQNEGWTDFDKAIAVRNMMPKVGRLGRVLGPRGLMPSPKGGTVVGPEEIVQAVREVKGGRVDFRVEKAGIVHAPVGKASMTKEALRDNVLVFLQTLMRLKPASAKGTYLKGIALAGTMGPGVRVDVGDINRLSAEYR